MRWKTAIEIMKNIIVGVLVLLVTTFIFITFIALLFLVGQYISDSIQTVLWSIGLLIGLALLIYGCHEAGKDLRKDR